MSVGYSQVARVVGCRQSSKGQLGCCRRSSRRRFAAVKQQGVSLAAGGAARVEWQYGTSVRW